MSIGCLTFSKPKKSRAQLSCYSAVARERPFPNCTKGPRCKTHGIVRGKVRQLLNPHLCPTKDGTQEPDFNPQGKQKAKNCPIPQLWLSPASPSLSRSLCLALSTKGRDSGKTPPPPPHPPTPKRGRREVSLAWRVLVPARSSEATGLPIVGLRW